MSDGKSERELEEEQIRRLNALRRILLIVAGRWLWVALAAFVAVAGTLTFLLVRRTARSCERVVVQTKLQFYPKSAAKIPAMDARQVFQILTRDTMVRDYIKRAKLTGVERLRAWIDLSLTQNRWDPRLFEITVKANTEARAVEKANCFADICLEEYAAYRRAELEKWLKTIDARRQELLAQSAALAADEQRLAQTHGVLAPEADVERLRTTISEQKVRLSELDVKATNEDLRVKRLKAELGTVSAKAFGHADELKDLQEELRRAEKEIVRLRELYTDKNPRLAVVLKTRADCRARLDAFLKAHEMPAMTVAELERLTAVYEKLRNAEVECEIHRSGRTALAQEIAANERQLKTLSDLLPQFEAFRRQRETLQPTIQGLEETISDIRYLQASIAGDLTQVERATGGRIASPYAKKNFLLGLAGGLFAAGGLLTLLVLVDFLFGRVRNAREAACYLGVRSLGPAVPKAACPAGVAYKDTLDRICLQIERETAEKAVHFMGVLPGGAFVDELGEAMHWLLTMAGRRVVVLDIVPAKTFEAPEGAEFLASVCLMGGRGWFARANPLALSPSETKLLGEDIATLRTRFDLVLLRCAEPVTSDIFLRQMLEIAEVPLFHVGAGRTPRAALRRLARDGAAVGKVPLVVVDGRLTAKDFAEEAS